jgi:hypothetical protein
MADDVATPSDPPVAPIEKEKIEEALLDVNVFQQSREKELSKRMARTQFDHSARDRRLFPNLHALAIYLVYSCLWSCAIKVRRISM